MQFIFHVIVIRDTGTWCNAIYQDLFDFCITCGLSFTLFTLNSILFDTL